MINALTQSPLVAKKIYEWKEKIEKNELLVREIIDIDSTYEDFEAISEEKEKVKTEIKTQKNKEDNTKVAAPAAEEEDEFNVSLAKMEEEIKPKIIKIIDNLTKDYIKLQKYQKEKLDCILSSKELSISKNKNFKKIQTTLVDNFKNLQLATHVIEEIVQSHYKENKKIVSLEGVLLRLALDNKISRE